MGAARAGKADGVAGPEAIWKEAADVATANSKKAERSAAQKAVQFKPGQSGNPSGRPKKDPEVMAMLKAACPDACRLLCNVINDETAKTDLRVKCAEIIMDRVYGKPQQAVEVDAKNIPQVIFVGGDKIAD